MDKIKIISILVFTLLIATAVFPMVSSIAVSRNKVEKTICDNITNDLTDDTEISEISKIFSVVVGSNDGDNPPSETLDICVKFGFDGGGGGTIPFNLPAGNYDVKIGVAGTFVYYYSIRDNDGKWVSGYGLVFNSAHLFGNPWNQIRDPIAGTQIATGMGVGNGAFQICFVPT